MVIVNLMGGLGNQLFQYAAARRIAEVNKSTLKLDISFFENYKLHVYSLNHLNIIEEFATPSDISSLIKANSLTGRVTNFFNKNRYTDGHERYYYVNPHILKATGNIYLDGYWQSEQYFKDIENIIRAEFRVKTKPDPQNEAMAKIISNCNAVNLHIRRGDYVNNSATNQIYGTCDLDYYYRAVDDLHKYISEPCFFVFSDDIQWAKENLKINHPVTFIDFNGPDKNYEDLRLMSLCKHHIIANSSFSWWGAWLSSYKEKRVYAPKKWFNSSNVNTRDLIPSAWKSI